MAATLLKPKLVSTDGRTVRVDIGQPYTLSASEAQEVASGLSNIAGWAESAPDFHQNHVNLKADCPLCVYEANGQTDRLVRS